MFACRPLFACLFAGSLDGAYIHKPWLAVSLTAREMNLRI